MPRGLPRQLRTVREEFSPLVTAALLGATLLPTMVTRLAQQTEGPPEGRILTQQGWFLPRLLVPTQVTILGVALVAVWVRLLQRTPSTLIVIRGHP